MFELVLMEMVGEKLTSTHLQFGFKANSSCSHAIFYTSDVSKAFLQFRQHSYLCVLDISKAFDRVDVYGLLNALMTRRFPKTFVCIMFNWLQKFVGAVRWGNCLSMILPIIADVRQGGLLSPALFAIYIDDLIRRLKASKFGCCLNGVYFGCLAVL